MTIELNRIRIFDVLRNELNGELAVVMSVSGDLLDLRDKTGAVARFKYGKHFSRASDDVSIDFRAKLRELRKTQQPAGKKKKTPRSIAALLARLSKKRR